MNTYYIKGEKFIFIGVWKYSKHIAIKDDNKKNADWAYDHFPSTDPVADRPGAICRPRPLGWESRGNRLDSPNLVRSGALKLLLLLHRRWLINTSCFGAFLWSRCRREGDSCPSRLTGRGGSPAYARGRRDLCFHDCPILDSNSTPVGIFLNLC